MKLPYAKNAYIPKEKLLGYLLSAIHPIGKFKAKFFRKLGFNETNVDKLERVLLSIAQKNEVEDIKKNSYGKSYIINGSINSKEHKSVVITTIWFIDPKQNRRPRFVTAIPGIIKTKEGNNR